jgi:hypothetical protein
VTVIGTSDRSILHNWYSGSAYQLDAITMNDGKVLLAGQIELIQRRHVSVDPVLAASWH